MPTFGYHNEIGVGLKIRLGPSGCLLAPPPCSATPASSTMFTLTIDDDLLAQAEAYAQRNGIDLAA